MASLERIPVSESQRRIHLIQKLMNLGEDDTVSLDLDQTAALSSSGVAKRFNARMGTNYGPHKYRWFHYANLALEDGFIRPDQFDEIAEFEQSLWIDPEALAEAEPDPVVRTLSLILSERGVRQFVVTSRAPTDGMPKMTSNWVEENYSWIANSDIHIRLDGPPEYDHGAFKSKMVGLLNPTVHADDAVSDGGKILKLAPNTLFLFLPHLVDINGLWGSQVLQFINSDQLASAMSHNLPELNSPELVAQS